MIFVTDGNVIYRSSDSGSHWTRANIAAASGITSPIISFHGSLLAAGQESGSSIILASTDDGLDWVSISTQHFWPFVRSITCIDSLLFVSCPQEHIWLSSNEGENWTDSLYQPLYVNALLGVENTLYAGSYQQPTLIRSTDYGLTSEKYNSASDWTFVGQDSEFVGAHSSHDTIEYSYVSKYDIGDPSRGGSAVSSTQSIIIVLSADGITCQSAFGSVSSSDVTTNPIGGPYTTYDKTSHCEFVRLPLAEVSADTIRYGIVGSQAYQSFSGASLMSQDGLTTWPGYTNYDGTNWNSTTPMPELLVTFRR